ncbi:hypothetical protein TNCV_4099571 [Trichonephila clavipes]|nr:hypothetical protein TNCV_4099571 [Trichonephila clavipes]
MQSEKGEELSPLVGLLVSHWENVSLGRKGGVGREKKQKVGTKKITSHTSRSRGKRRSGATLTGQCLATSVPQGLGPNPEEGYDVCKHIVSDISRG